MTFPPRRQTPPKAVPRLTWAERTYLLLQRSASARAAAVAVVTLPALIVAGLFWWSVQGDFDSLPPQQDSSVTTRAAAVAHIPENRLFPAEFERQDGMLLGCNELAPLHPRIMLDMIEAMHGKLEIYGIINSPQQRDLIVSLLEERKLPPNAIRLIELPSVGMWIRDYGPKFLRNSVGGLTIVDYSYLDIPATDGRTRPDDDKIPALLSKYFLTALTQVPLSMEGGNLLTNGYGNCLSTTQLVRENEHRRYDVQDVFRVVCEAYKQSGWTYVPYVENDPTRHVDTFVAFTSRDTVVVGSCDPLRDAQAAEAMNKAAEQLSRIAVDGAPMKVVRIAMDLRNDDVTRTYTNVVFANGTLLVPQYADVDEKLNKAALATYAELLPGWKIVGIECLELVRKGGALHCITCNVPSSSLLPIETAANEKDGAR